MKTTSGKEAEQLIQEHKIVQRKLEKANKILRPFTSEQINSIFNKGLQIENQ